MLFPELASYSDLALLIVRLVVGSIFIYYGWPKFKDSAARAESLGFSPLATKALGAVEVLAGAMVIVGLYVQIAALAIIVIMAGAIYKKAVAWKVGYFADNGSGWNYDTLLLAIGFVLLTIGSGSIGF